MTGGVYKIRLVIGARTVNPRHEDLASALPRVKQDWHARRVVFCARKHQTGR